MTLLPVPGVALRADLGVLQSGTSPATVRGPARPALTPLRLSSLLTRLRTVMPEGSCVKAHPRCAHQQDNPRGLAASEGCMACQAGLGAGGPRSQALCVPGGLAAHARAGRGAGVGWRAAWWQRAPTPLVGRCAPWLDEWSFTGRAVCCRAPVAGRVLLPLTARRGSGAPWQWPAPGSRRRLPIAAALFLPPQDAQCNPGGATSRAGLALLGALAHP